MQWSPAVSEIVLFRSSSIQTLSLAHNPARPAPGATLGFWIFLREPVFAPALGLDFAAALFLGLLGPATARRALDTAASAPMRAAPRRETVWVRLLARTAWSRCSRLWAL